MAGNFLQKPAGVWGLARRQHDVASREQLLELGLTRHAIGHRLANGRLHRLWDGVYAVGSPHVSREGLWLAATLACGPDAAVSHDTSAALLSLIDWAPHTIHVSVPEHVNRQRRGICVHRRRLPTQHLTRVEGIPTTDAILTCVDLAATRHAGQVEAAVNRADKLDLVDPETLRAALNGLGGIRGAAALRRLLDHRTFVLTESELERAFVRIIRRACLPSPESGVLLNGFRIDFYWPSLGLIVETDGLRYHRTPAQQATDRRRDQAHTAAGYTTLRFTHAQVAYEPDAVARILTETARRLDPRG